MTLLLMPCTNARARDAVVRWHYSRRLPPISLECFSATEGGEDIGAIVFGPGSRLIGKPYGLDNRACCELQRVALRDGHRTPTSRIVAITLRLLKARRPHLRLVVSFADTAQNHHGGIYQAGNWIYSGESHWSAGYVVNGVVMHMRTATGRPGGVAGLRATFDPNAYKVNLPHKYKYLMPLDPATRAQLIPLAKPYPKRAISIDGDAPATRAGQGGSIPTMALSKEITR